MRTRRIGRSRCLDNGQLAFVPQSLHRLHRPVESKSSIEVDGTAVDYAHGNIGVVLTGRWCNGYRRTHLAVALVTEGSHNAETIRCSSHKDRHKSLPLLSLGGDGAGKP